MIARQVSHPAVASETERHRLVNSLVRGPSPAICPAFKRSSSFHHVRLARSAARSARRRLLHLGHLRQALRGSRGRQPPGGRPLCAIATAASATAASACVSMSPGDIERGAPAPSLVFTRVSPCCAGGRQPKARAVRRLRSTARFDGSTSRLDDSMDHLAARAFDGMLALHRPFGARSAARLPPRAPFTFQI